jgi:hypothetical protein
MCAEKKSKNMIKEKVAGQTYSFSQSNLQRFIANYLDRFAWVCIFFVIAFAIARVRSLSAYGIIISILLCIIPYLYAKIQKKFAYKIVVDFESRKVRLHMHRSDAVITADFDDIKSIRVNGYIIFVLEDRRVFYNDLQNNELFDCLNRIMEIHWGFLCAIWGPRRNVRNALSGTHGDKR